MASRLMTLASELMRTRATNVVLCVALTMGIVPLVVGAGSTRARIVLPADQQHSSRFSPDGRWLAYASNETGRFEVFVEPVPATGARVQLTREAGGHPLWSTDGRTLYFDRTGRLFSV